MTAYDLVRHILKQASDCGEWSEDFNTVRDTLEQCISVAHRWIASCKQLTEVFWPNYSLHAWTGEPFVPQQLSNLEARLKEVSN